MLLFVYINLIFTYLYTSRLLGFCTSYVKLTPYYISSFPLLHAAHLIILATLSILFGYFYSCVNVDFVSPVPVLPFARVLPSFLLALVLYLMYSRISRSIVSSFPLLSSRLGTIIFLTPINSNFLSKKSYAIITNITKTLEHGLLTEVSLKFPLLSVISFSRLV